MLILAALGALKVVISPGSAQIALECGLVLGGFAAITVWARRNRTALDQQDWCDCAGAKVTMRVIPSRRSELVHSEHADEGTLVEETLEEAAGEGPPGQGNVKDPSANRDLWRRAGATLGP